MVLNAAVQTLREAEELKQKVLKFKNGVSMLQERSLWVTQQQLQKLYQKLLVLDLDYALDKKVEQDLWNVGFKQQIEALQVISKDRKNPRRSDGQQMLAWVLQAAAGFYLCLLHQICTAFKLDLPFRRRASLLGAVEAWGAGQGDASAPPPAAALYICQHCLVHLGDLARYRQQLRAAHTFYRHALLVSAHSGQPYNQLALVSWRRGRRLGALYWHVRSLLVRAPFPPAPANLARTLAAAAASAAAASQQDGAVNSRASGLPVLPGVTDSVPLALAHSPAPLPGPLTAHTFVGELIRAYHLIHTMDDLETAARLVNTLNSSLTALVATDSFESMTLIKMACITIWLVGWATEELQVGEEGLTEAESSAAELATSLAAGALVSLLFCSHSHTAPALPALKVYLEWVVANPRLLGSAAVLSRPQLWPALAHTLNALAEHTRHFHGQSYETAPLPEDEELHGFVPLEGVWAPLRFTKFASWDTYGDRLPDCEPHSSPPPPASPPPASPPATPPPAPDEHSDGDTVVGETADSLRAWRLVELGRRVAELLEERGAHYIRVSVEDGASRFEAPQSSPELLRALEELSLARAAREGSTAEGAGVGGGGGADSERESDDEARPPPPIIISEADFREKVREKRVGILKPQGSLERAREERALAAATHDSAQQTDAESAAAGERVEGARPGEDAAAGGAAVAAAAGVAARTRTNVAMQAILRVQEESSKQVKFVTPVTTPDSTLESLEVSPVKESEKTKILQPKAMKSLANLPLGKKTGGILSLKDKSAGYPHLVNADPEPQKKSDDVDKVKKENPSAKLSQGPSQNSQNTFHPSPYPSKMRQENLPAPAPAPRWSPQPPPAPYSDTMNRTYPNVKPYPIQSNVANFNPSYSQNVNPQGPGIRLPVVNPKEIDVRSAALHKQQYSRQDTLAEGSKFGMQNFQFSGDKKAFLNDLPPRFANQFKNWPSAQNEPQYSAPAQDSNTFREDPYKSNNMLFGNNNVQSVGHPNWSNPTRSSDSLAQPSYRWWSPDSAPSTFNYAPPSMNQPPPTFYPQMSGNVANPYRTPNYNPMGNQKPGYDVPSENLSAVGSNYMQSGLGQPQAHSLQNLIKSPNYNAAVSSFGNYSPSVSYDSSMYPQFTSNKLGYQPPSMKTTGLYARPKEPMVDLGRGLGLGSASSDLHQRSHLTMDLMAGVLTNDNMNLMKSLDQLGMAESGAEGGNQYSLFSAGGEEAGGSVWGGGQHPTHTPHHHSQSLWSGPGPSPLERLLEQQKQLNKSATATEPQ